MLDRFNVPIRPGGTCILLELVLPRVLGPVLFCPTPGTSWVHPDGNLDTCSFVELVLFCPSSPLPDAKLVKGEGIFALVLLSCSDVGGKVLRVALGKDDEKPFLPLAEGFWINKLWLLSFELCLNVLVYTSIPLLTTDPTNNKTTAAVSIAIWYFVLERFNVDFPQEIF